MNKFKMVFVIMILFITYLGFKFDIEKIKIKYKKWYQCKKGDSVSKLFHSVLENNNMERTFANDWDLYLPCNNKYGEKYLKKITTTNENQVITFISKNGILGSKEYIWIMLEKYYGRDISSNIMPKSYIFPKDYTTFEKEFNSNKYYVLKSEAQRQTGIKITNNYQEIINSRNNGFKIVQEYINNPIKFKNYKINFRIYLLVVCNPKKNKKIGYVFDDGIVSYAKSKDNFSNEINFDKGVASFYTSKHLYAKGFPITINTLKTKMVNIDWDYIYHSFYDKIYQVLKATNSLLCSHEYNYNNKSFQIFGVDFLVTQNGEIYILEINIGPGMSPFNEIDEEMRIKLHKDMLSIVGIIPNNRRIINGFKKIYEEP